MFFTLEINVFFTNALTTKCLRMNSVCLNAITPTSSKNKLQFAIFIIQEIFPLKFEFTFRDVKLCTLVLYYVPQAYMYHSIL